MVVRNSSFGSAVSKLGFIYEIRKEARALRGRRGTLFILRPACLLLFCALISELICELVPCLSASRRPQASKIDQVHVSHFSLPSLALNP